MALINCPECGTQVSNKADKCPQCAYPLKTQTNVESEGCFLQTMNFGCSLIVWLTITIVIIAIIGTILAN